MNTGEKERAWPKFWVTAGFTGLCPVAPGTCGTLLGLVLAMAVTQYTAVPRIQTMLLLSLILLFSGVTVLYGEWAEQAFGRKDPPQVVSDEVAGFLVAVLWVPQVAPGIAWLKLGTAFLLFRAFDILKPPPLRHLQAIGGGLGILVDDLGAGLLANGCLQLILRKFAVYQGL
jgi:phosphatidylglycerophosphatase A